jgi:hypothetical protein
LGRRAQLSPSVEAGRGGGRLVPRSGRACCGAAAWDRCTLRGGVVGDEGSRAALFFSFPFWYRTPSYHLPSASRRKSGLLGLRMSLPGQFRSIMGLL